MADRIQILPAALANKIAAGEVIARPASVVKELVENALDAGASRIDVECRNGGKSLIQVRDNGSGMSSADLEMAFQRHATSKIRHADDLFAIRTMGFRGEALPSIGSVAVVDATSREQDQQTGNRLVIDGGVQRGPEPAAFEQGTRVTVKNLFFNVPARLKFMKSDNTELNHIIARMQELALAHPEVNFRLKQGTRLIIDTKAGTPLDRVRSLFGAAYADKVVPVASKKGQLSVAGFVGGLDLVRSRRGEQYLFVNGRPVTDRLLNNAVYQAYRSLTAKGQHPFYLLHIHMPEQDLDVNVHPAKAEVRFKDEWRVYYVVKAAVEEGLAHTEKILPGFSDQPPLPKPTAALPTDSRSYAAFPLTPTPAVPPAKPQREQILFDADPAGEAPPYQDKAEQFSASLEQEGSKPVAQRRQGGLLWQIHNKYIVTEIATGMVIIDQHVAHERVLFEEAMAGFKREQSPSQQLLFPQPIKLSAEDFNQLLELLPLLVKLGFNLREAEEGAFVLEGVPLGLRQGAEAGILQDILDHYRSERSFSYSEQKRVAASYSCKSAVKAGDALSDAEMQMLIDRLFACEHPFFCPHGRPVLINLSIDELDKRFERH